MVEMQANRHKLVEVFERFESEGGSFITAEEAIFGANHQDFGRGLCERWKFPRSFAYVTGYHHRPLDLDPGTRILTNVIYVAEFLAKQHDVGFTQDIESSPSIPSFSRRFD